VEVYNPCELDAFLVRAIEPVSNLAEDVGVRSMRIIEARCVNKEASLATDLCLVYADINCACTLLDLPVSSVYKGFLRM
jgi:hypothetical protein